MNTPALVSRLDHKALPQWNAGAPGYIAMQSASGGGGDDRNASRLSQGIRRYWWVAVLLWALVAIPACIMIYRTIQPQYVATGTIVVSPYQRDAFKSEDKVTPFYGEYLRTQADLIKTYDVLSTAAKRPELTSFAWFRDLTDQVGYLQQNLNVEVVPATQNIRLTMTHNDAQAAKAVVQAVMGAYIDKNNDDQQKINQQALNQLKTMRDDTKGALDGAKSQLERQLAQVDMTGAEKWMPEVLAAGYTRLAELKKNRFSVNAELDAVKAKPLPSQETFMNSVNVDNDSQIVAWENARMEASKQDAILETKFRAQPQHPDRKAYRQQITKMENLIAARKKDIRDTAWKKYEADTALDRELKVNNLTWNRDALDQQIATQEKTLRDQESAAKEMGNKAQPIATLRKQVTDLEEELKGIISRMEEVTRQNSPLGRLDPQAPGLPLTPTVDRRPKLALAANGMGFLLGMGVLVILMKLRDKIDYAEDLPSNFQPLIVGTVSHAGAAARGLEGRMSKKILGEEMRLLHANLLPPGPMQRRIMMITSPTPSNGKTSIASQLALSLAKSGLEVLLIDADLRKRDLSTMFDVGFRPGLADLLQGRTPELIRPVELLPNLRLMGAGTKLDRNPVELFQRKHFHENLNMLQEKFDCIVVDTPPTLVVADARLIARSADEVLCVVRAAVSSPKDVNQTIDALQRITGKTPKIIVNGVAHKQSYYKYKFAYTSGDNETAASTASADSLD